VEDEEEEEEEEKDPIDYDSPEFNEYV